MDEIEQQEGKIGAKKLRKLQDKAEKKRQREVCVVGTLFQHSRKLSSAHLSAYTLRPPDRSVYWKIIFFVSHPKHMSYVVCTQKNRLNETVLLSTQNTCLN